MAFLFDLTKPQLAYYSVSSVIAPQLSPSGDERGQIPTLAVILTTVIQGARGLHAGDGAAFLRDVRIRE